MIDRDKTCKTDDCSGAIRAWGYCDTCYRREVYHGRIVPKKQKSIRSRISEKTIVASSGCLEWSGLLDRHGYARMKIKAKSSLVHRAVFELRHGEIPEGKIICHTCDNRKCININHLYLGTHKDNRADCIARGRENQRRSEDGTFRAR